MSVRALSPITCKIIRISDSVTSDVGDPAEQETTVFEIACRFDRDKQRTISNMIRKDDMRSLQTVGRLYIDIEGIPTTLDATTGVPTPVEIQDTDVIEIAGRRYTIYELNAVYGFSNIDHYEIDLVDYVGV